MTIVKPIFHHDVTRGAGAFKLAEFPRGPVYLTAELVSKIEAIGATPGTSFKPTGG